MNNSSLNLHYVIRIELITLHHPGSGDCREFWNNRTVYHFDDGSTFQVDAFTVDADIKKPERQPIHNLGIDIVHEIYSYD